MLFRDRMRKNCTLGNVQVRGNLAFSKNLCISEGTLPRFLDYKGEGGEVPFQSYKILLLYPYNTDSINSCGYLKGQLATEPSSVLHQETITTI